MTSVQQHMVTQSHTSGSHLDNHLDALLDDLQTSVSRPGTSLALTPRNGPALNGSAFGGQINLPPGASGYREITTTVTRDTNGVPMTSRDYQIEYLNPANSVTVLDERSSSPALELLKSGDLAGHQVQSYKTEVYDYKFSKTTSDKKSTAYGGTPRMLDDSKNLMLESKSYYQSEPQNQENSHSRTEKVESIRGETNVGKNLNELDMLLKELNTPSGASGETRTTPRREHVQMIETRVEKSSGRDADMQSTVPRRSASVTREVNYEEKTQSRMNRAQSPTVTYGTPKPTGRTINVRREYNTVESTSHSSRRDSPSTRNRSAEMSPTLRRRTPSPSSGEFRPSNFSNYPISPKDLTPTRTVTTSKSYGYSSTGRTATPTTFDDPQPYRSPSPVSFPQRRSPSPVRKNLNRSDSGRTVSYQVSPLTSENPTVLTYKYSSHSTEQSRYPGSGYDERDESLRRPFPSNIPAPVGEQNPPKKLDELMASFQDNKGRPPQGGEYTHKIEYSRESHERHDGGSLQRSPSFERNLRPSNVKITQSYSQQMQQQGQDQGQRQNQYQQRDQFVQNEQREHPGTYRKEYQREEYHTREHYPRQQYQQQQQQQQEQYQRNQYQQYHSSQGGGYQKGSHEQFQQRQDAYQQNQSQYQQNQQYQFQQQQQQHYQQNYSQKPVGESMSSSQAYRSTSATKSVAGPPVYYPPGVELFTKKEEAMLKQEQGGGKKKSKGKSKSKSDKDKGKGVSGVPMCLPVCCAMPCSIM